MSEFLFAYGLFIAKVVTGLIALVFVIALIAGSRKKEEEGELKVMHLNQKLDQLQNKVLQTVLDKKAFKAHQKSQAKESKAETQKGRKVMPRPKMYVLEFEGDIKASQVATLRDEITALLAVAKSEDEILLILDNSGGMVHEHGLAASQLQRLKDAKLNFTVSVDKVAASGGYMMACVADKIIAAPFAILGSIGVLAQLPNFNRLLDKHGIDFEQHTAGEFKRTVTMFGKNSDKEREKLKLDLQQTHVLFRDFVAQHRPNLDLDKVATGEHWYGLQALDLNLIDQIQTSDDFLIKAKDSHDIYQLKMEAKKPLQEKLLGSLATLMEKVGLKMAQEQNNSRFV